MFNSFFKLTAEKTSKSLQLWWWQQTLFQNIGIQRNCYENMYSVQTALWHLFPGVWPNEVWYLQTEWWPTLDPLTRHRLNIKTVFPRCGISMLKIRRLWNLLIFNIGIPMLVRWHLYIEMALRALFQYKDVLPVQEIIFLEIRQSQDHLISTMRFLIKVKWHFYFESAPRTMYQYE